jgi:hypothetical protein
MDRRVLAEQKISQAKFKNLLARYERELGRYLQAALDEFEASMLKAVAEFKRAGEAAIEQLVRTLH